MATFPEEILDDNEHRGARLVALALLADAAAQRERLGRSGDKDALHDFRVAIRRLRSWLRAQSDVLADAAPKKVHKRLRRVAQATNHSRDAEVFAEWIAQVRASLTPRQRSGARWLLKRLARVRDRADKEVSTEVERDFERVREYLEERLPVYHVAHHVDDGARLATFAGEMSALVRSHTAALRRRLDVVRSPSDDESAHRARIAGKRVRYLLEPIVPHVASGAETIDRLKRLQDALGDFHDTHVWLSSLRAAIEEAAVEEGRELSKSARLNPPTDAPRKRSAATDPRPGLIALADLVRARAQSTFELIRDDWVGGAATPLFDGIEQVVSTLDTRARSGVEIERKFLLRAMPHELPPATVKEIEQGYLPGKHLIERLRRVAADDGTHWYRTVKIGAGLVRTEMEDPCSEELFDSMWPGTDGKRLTKRRHVVPEGALNWEIDEFTDRTLVVAEVELPSADVVPEIPVWLEQYVVREVTHEAEYVNFNLAR
ncbi:MAG: CHAD domain-containing protein [Gemmatimonadaceae bacterium]